MGEREHIMEDSGVDAQEESTAELIKRLLKEYEPALRRYARYLCRTATQISPDDLIQDLWLEMIENEPKTFDRNKVNQGFFMRILKVIFLKKFERITEKPIIDDPKLMNKENSLSDDKGTPEDLLLKNETIAKVTAALQRFTEDWEKKMRRTPSRMIQMKTRGDLALDIAKRYYMEGLSQAEIAKQLHIHVNVVQRTLPVVKSILKKALEDLR